MQILGHGIDLVANERIADMLEKHGERFLSRCFTEREIAYASDGSQKRRIERLAGRFAVKEAVLKALGTGWRNGIAWTDMEIVLDPRGKPDLVLTGVAGETARDLGATQWWISLSHTQTHAIGSAIAVGNDV